MTVFYCLFALLQCLRTQNFRSGPCSANPDHRVCPSEFTRGEMRVVEELPAAGRPRLCHFKVNQHHLQTAWASTSCGLIASPKTRIKWFSTGLHSNIDKGQISSYKWNRREGKASICDWRDPETPPRLGGSYRTGDDPFWALRDLLGWGHKLHQRSVYFNILKLLQSCLKLL